jgi:beta-glucosidase
VTNAGPLAGDEVVQVYISAGRDGYPLRQLAAFERIHLLPGAMKTVTFVLSWKRFTRVLDDGARVLEPGTFSVFAGSGQPGWAKGVETSVEVLSTGLT